LLERMMDSSSITAALAKGFSVRKNYVEWDDDNQEIILRKLVVAAKVRVKRS
jgi:hypothetical protein